MTYSRLGRERGSWQSGNALRRPRRGEHQRAHDDAPPEFDLELVVAGRLRPSEGRFRSTAEIFVVRRSPCQQPFGIARAPWFCGDAAEGDARVRNLAARDAQ